MPSPVRRHRWSIRQLTDSTILTTACRTINCSCSASRHTMKSCRLRAISYQVTQKLKRATTLRISLKPLLAIPRVGGMCFIYIQYTFHIQHFYNCEVLFLKAQSHYIYRFLENCLHLHIRFLLHCLIQPLKKSVCRFHYIY